ncbi:hypothetical protein SELMODRAFT_182522 [Selaginella moellendorffii]|uniref:RRM domain-containing protein n=1 Tax=Selaginella moellendorffii TaxID=88036 RepID=D8STJ0_SELML|nr:multiple RNA-binding domain-containing protein 1 [Selaginella moellendorffii]EFJ12267.1 hypothetical protein SELMODRAFT_182522 [Selaginella moellendorffii]|eukprot:XP_002986704.1 multiple RNA-binding domain-containing protein 1 [Selaginella moellendorffii]
MGSSSRVCVKNLPTYVTDDKLREHFGAKGQVTDAKVMRTRDGKSRRFGFVGFYSQEEAESAVAYFNRSFLDTSRLVCEVARSVGDAAVRPWSRHSKGSSAYEKTHAPEEKAQLKPKKTVSVDRDQEQDPGLDEFLSVMQPRTKTKVWANDDAKLTTQQPSSKASDDAGPVSDLYYLKSKVRQQWSDDSDDEKETEGGAKPQQQADTGDRPGNEEAAQDVAETDTGRLFVRNLAYTTSEEELASLFGQYGEVVQVHLICDKETNRSKGYGYVGFTLPEEATRAMTELDNSIFQGRLLHVLPAKQQTSQVKQKLDRPMNLKQEREVERKKKESSGNTQAWNPLYMRPDTVAENVARQYGISRREFLDPEAEDVAVRLALGETHVLSETKRSLAQQGVNVELLEKISASKTSGVTRSSRVILVKNLPFSTTEVDLFGVFCPYGSLGRLVLPPTKTVAIVEFLESSEARKAFESLAYRKFKHVPLYLEWAPQDLLSEKKDGGVVPAKLEGTSMKDQLVANDEGAASTRSSTVFVKNLNFKTTDASLRKHFEGRVKAGSLRTATVKRKPSKTGASLSMGFGFVEFDSADTAERVCKEMQGSVLDGHALVLQPSRAGDDEKPSKVDAKGSSSKLIVRNVAFEATRKDLKQLFSPFGQVKKVKLPKKFDGNHRGFAFVEFVTKQEAQNAFEALGSSHLYGRHLVLEWAREGETLDELRIKAASQVAPSKPNKRRKLS